MNPSENEFQELEQRMRVSMQKAGYIIPSSLHVDEEPPLESMEASIPESLRDVDAAMKRIFCSQEDDRVVGFPRAIAQKPFAMAARNGELELSEETLNKLKRKKD